MFYSQSFNAILFTLLLTTCLSWSFPKIQIGILKIANRDYSGFKLLLYSFLLWSPLLFIESSLPEYLVETFFSAFPLFLTICLWWKLNKKLNNREKLGKIIFKSQKTSAFTFATLLLFLPVIFGAVVQYSLLLLDRDSSIDLSNVIHYWINIKLFSIAMIAFFLSLLVYIIFDYWLQLVIREKGICYMDNIPWENIKQYSIKGDRTKIFYLNHSKKIAELAIPITLTEKEQVDQLFTDNIEH